MVSRLTLAALLTLLATSCADGASRPDSGAAAADSVAADSIRRDSTARDSAVATTAAVPETDPPCLASRIGLPCRD